MKHVKGQIDSSGKIKQNTTRQKMTKKKKEKKNLERNI